MKFDPYETLGVDRDATEAEIKRAAKEKAKETHPDTVNGDVDKFHDNRRALAILTDPKKRARFDRTGDAAEMKPDNAASRAMEMIYHELAEATNAFLLSNFDPQKDPRRMDIVANIKATITNNIAKAEEMVRGGADHAAFLRDFRSRFKKKTPKGREQMVNEAFDFIARKLEDEIIAVEAKAAELEEMIAGARLSLELIKTYDFRFDPPAPAPASTNYHFNNLPGGYIFPMT